ncbi:transcription factor TFIIIB subunit BDP1 [Spizellomyces punctatus DAOM BR117]|uniref:Transcription factor TFIIIB component B'' Myb domain-containing protein n=1 Tax=Spizellomyces punctatus (strain DAOM BR117) TaxID=645134 RepID=A0A0L0H971_SPIPD|nr:transcription factor TFIIIB subunit BDP1 [Spizellomyces punctatus DAOM BR117]KNC97742.1 hypothetical protein SPPG_06744 [Spizellomyces punctatus DAOM BR117]|eukprot:XP_016605782.1 hypothetical protein SPPG_06744 [Spizellomyces punctatus DAOM BR117]
MVELTLSTVSRGPNKFAPAPKVRPRPGRERINAPKSTPAPGSASASQSKPTGASGDPVSVESVSVAPSAVLVSHEATPPIPALSTQIPLLSATPLSNTSPLPSSTAPLHDNNDVSFLEKPVSRAPGPSVITRSLGHAQMFPRDMDEAGEGNFSRLNNRPTAPPRIGAVSGASLPVRVPKFVSRDIDDEFDDDYVPKSVLRVLGPPKIGVSNPTSVEKQGGALPVVSAHEDTVEESHVRQQGLSDALPEQIPRIGLRRSMRGDLSGEGNEDRLEESPMDIDLDESTIPQASIGDLIKHKFPKGKLSRIEELRQQQRKEQRRRAGKREGTPSTTRAESPAMFEAVDDEVPDINLSGPRLIMVDGKLQVDQDSLVIRTHVEDEADLEHVDEGMQRHITSASFRTRKRLGRVKWTKERTDRFYEGLSYFGADFSMICLMFPDLNRGQVKAKYNAEERVNGRRLTAALLKRLPLPKDLVVEMKDLVRQRVAKRKTLADESDEEAIPAMKRSAANTPTLDGDEAAATQDREDGNSQQLQHADRRDGDAETQESINHEGERGAGTLLGSITMDDDGGVPLSVPVSMGPPIRRNMAAVGVRPKVVPRAAARRKKQDIEQAGDAAESSVPSAQVGEQEGPQGAQPELPMAVTNVVKLSRQRTVPTIGSAASSAASRQTTKILTPAMRAQAARTAALRNLPEGDATEELVQQDDTLAGSDDFERENGE